MVGNVKGTNKLPCRKPRLFPPPVPSTGEDKTDPALLYKSLDSVSQGAVVVSCGLCPSSVGVLLMPSVCEVLLVK
ncbi:hypothetical protein BaRGS_00000553 [Batillaria attramentaria]|uniref:Uncharacterized protein n=1 Tax=Batillaria attramentaria TaxID=370345 RepID=A0ABD0MA13_9CAEN